MARTQSKAALPSDTKVSKSLQFCTVTDGDFLLVS